MKTNICKRAFMLTMLGLIVVGGYAQEKNNHRKSLAIYDSRSPLYMRNPYFRSFYNIDWQLNGTINNKVAAGFNGWGANFEGGYYLTPNWGLGLFASYHTNEEYIPRTTFVWHDAALNTDQIHSLFQLPFGITARYRFWSGTLMPYIGVKAGTEFSRAETYINGSCLYNTAWGFFISPEIGTEIHPFKRAKFGFHVAAYYNYATNDNSLLWYSAEGLNNFGVRIGIAF